MHTGCPDELREKERRSQEMGIRGFLVLALPIAVAELLGHLALACGASDRIAVCVGGFSGIALFVVLGVILGRRAHAGEGD